MGDSSQEKLPFPKTVILYICISIPGNLSFSLRKSVLIMYFTDSLGMSDSAAKTIYHTYYIPLGLLSPIGAVIADSYLGQWKQLLICIVMGTVVACLLPISAMKPWNPPSKALALTYFFSYPVIMGGLASCYTPFIGQQFLLPQQENQLSLFFYISYWTGNLFGTIGSIMGPFLRSSVHCFGDTTCYALTFGLGYLFHVIYGTGMVIGFIWFKKVPPSGKNVLVTVGSVISYALQRKKTATVKKDHWLDYADDKYDQNLIADVKKLKVFYMFLPAPLFYALYEQESSAWTFQARKMDGDLGFYNIPPDQMYALNWMLCVLLVPLFKYGLYPFFSNNFGFLSTLLQRMVTGTILCALAFYLSAFFCMVLERQEPVLPSPGQAHLRIYNTMNCQLNIKLSKIQEETVTIEKFSFWANTNLKISGSEDTPYEYTCGHVSKKGSLTFTEGTVMGFYFNSDGDIAKFEDDVLKGRKCLPKVRTLINSKNVVNIEYRNEEIIAVQSNSSQINATLLQIGTYMLFIGEEEIFSFRFRVGGVYVVMMAENAGKYEYGIATVTVPNSIQMLWMIPQYVLVVSGEVMFSISGTEFAYTQAPVRMKSCAAAMWFLSMSIGNFLVVIVETVFQFKHMSYNLLTYAILMTFNVGLIIFLAVNYKYVPAANYLE